MRAPPPGSTSPWPAAVAALDERLVRAFHDVIGWCRVADALADFRPGPEAWTGREVLEHVTLTDRYLLVLAEKIARKSARRAAAGKPWPAHPPAFAALEHLASRALRWRHPEHMTPAGTAELEDLARRLAADRDRARALLAAQPAGEGTLHRIRMSVVEGDDRLDLYQYLAVVALHAERHARQLERNRAAFAAPGERGTVQMD